MKAICQYVNMSKADRLFFIGAFQKSHLLYDRNGEQHYNIISALHKSVRGRYVEG